MNSILAFPAFDLVQAPLHYVDECDEQHGGGQCDVDHAVYILLDPLQSVFCSTGHYRPTHQGHDLIYHYRPCHESARHLSLALL